MLSREDNCIHESELTYRALYNPNMDNTLSVGTFHRLLSLCTRESNWKLKIDGHLQRNIAAFEVTKGTYLVITQKNDTIQVSTWTSKQEMNQGPVLNNEIRAILFDIHKNITRKMVILGVEHSTHFRMLCPHWRPGDEFVCLVEIEQKPDPRSDRSNFVFYPKSEECVIHNKALESHLFYVMGESSKGI